MALSCKLGWHRWIYNIENLPLVNKTRKIRLYRNFRTRLCDACNKKQYYTQRPLYNGISDNNWQTLK